MKTKLLALLLATLLLFSGCGKTQTLEQDGFSFIDDFGRTVSVEEPERVAALLGSYAQIWTLAGGTVMASADDAWDDFDLNMPDDAVNLGNTKELSLEKLLAAQPDFIIASTNTSQHLEWQETLEATGIPTAYFEVADFDDYLRMLRICCDITGRDDLYEENGAAVQEQIDSVLAQSKERLAENEAPTVLSMRASASSIRAKNSVGNVLGETLAALGCINIADSDDTLLENLSVERILEADPDYIFFVQQGDDSEGTQANIQRFFAENPAWSQLTAVKEGRVYIMEKALFGVKPNNCWGEAYQAVEDILQNDKT